MMFFLQHRWTPVVRSLLGCFALCAALIGPAYAQLEHAVRAFDEGNTYYRDGKYQDAIGAYLEAVNQGYASGALYYNLGNAYFRNDELGQAIRYYEKARLYIPESQELLHNLTFAQSQTVDRFSRLPVSWWTQWWRSRLVLSGGKWVLWVGLFLYMIGAALYVHRMRTRTRNPWFRRARAIVVGLAIFFLVVAFSASVQSERHEKAVVIVESLSLRSEPAQSSSSEVTIHEGLVVDVLVENDSWVEIRLPNGTRGWVEKETIAEV